VAMKYRWICIFLYFEWESIFKKCWLRYAEMLPVDYLSILVYTG